MSVVQTFRCFFSSIVGELPPESSLGEDEDLMEDVIGDDDNAESAHEEGGESMDDNSTAAR